MIATSLSISQNNILFVETNLIAKNLTYQYE
jgi:hypothetical protein